MTESTRMNVFGARLDIAHLLANSPPPLDHVLPGLVAGTVGMLAGPGGVGKTMLELQVAVSLAAGLARCDNLLGPDWGVDVPSVPCRVVLVAAEEPAEVLWGRIHHIVHSLDQSNVLPVGMGWADFQDLLHQNLHIYALGGARRVQLIDESLLLTQDLTDLHVISQGARLIILDPLRQLHLEDENQSAPMSALVSGFKQLARRTGAAVMFAHHTSRAASVHGYGESSDAARGSTALTADVRWQLNLATPTKEQLKRFGAPDDAVDRYVVLYNAKGNYQARSAPVLKRRAAGGVLVPVESDALQVKAKRTR